MTLWGVGNARHAYGLRYEVTVPAKLADPLGLGQELFEVFPEDGAIRKYLEWAHKAHGGPHIFHLASILPVCAYELDYRGFHLIRSTDRAKIPLTLWFMLIGDSGTGKSTAVDSAQDFFRDVLSQEQSTRMDPWVEPEGSIQGIVVALQDHYSHSSDTISGILYHREAAQVFSTREAISETLCKLADGRTFQANYRRNQKAKSSNPNADRVKNPHLSLIMATTEAQLAPYFKDAHRSGGIFTRLIWIKPNFERKHIRLHEDFDQIDALADEYKEAVIAMARWHAELATLKGETKKPGFTLSQGAYKELKKLFNFYKDAFEGQDTDNMHGVRMRLLEKTRVLACIIASQRPDPVLEVGADDMRRAAELTEVFLQHAHAMAHFSSDEIVRYAEKAEKLIKAAGEKGLFRKALYNRIRVGAPTMDKIMNTLEDRGRIYQDFTQLEGAYVHVDTALGQKIREHHDQKRRAEQATRSANHRRTYS